MLRIASAARMYLYRFISPGNNVRQKRMNPYAPSLLTMPAKNTSTAGGQLSYRSGSHVWNGTIGILIANASAKQMKASCFGVNVERGMSGMTSGAPALIGCARICSRSNEPDGDWM